MGVILILNQNECCQNVKRELNLPENFPTTTGIFVFRKKARWLFLWRNIKRSQKMTFSNLLSANRAVLNPKKGGKGFSSSARRFGPTKKTVYGGLSCVLPSDRNCFVESDTKTDLAGCLSPKLHFNEFKNFLTDLQSVAKTTLLKRR